MSLFTALHQTYNYGLAHGIVDNDNEDKSLLLPLYHNSMKSNGKNILEIKLD